MGLTSTQQASHSKGPVHREGWQLPGLSTCSGIILPRQVSGEDEIGISSTLFTPLSEEGWIHAKPDDLQDDEGGQQALRDGSNYPTQNFAVTTHPLLEAAHLKYIINTSHQATPTRHKLVH